MRWSTGTTIEADTGDRAEAALDRFQAAVLPN